MTGRDCNRAQSNGVTPVPITCKIGRCASPETSVCALRSTCPSAFCSIRSDWRVYQLDIGIPQFNWRTLLTAPNVPTSAISSNTRCTRELPFRRIQRGQHQDAPTTHAAMVQVSSPKAMGFHHECRGCDQDRVQEKTAIDCHPRAQSKGSPGRDQVPIPRGRRCVRHSGVKRSGNRLQQGQSIALRHSRVAFCEGAPVSQSLVPISIQRRPFAQATCLTPVESSIRGANMC